MLGLRQAYPLAALLSAAGLSRSTFYYHAAQVEPRQDDLCVHIERIYHQHRGRYGYRRVALALRREGLHVNHKAVQRRMQAVGLKSLVRPKRYQSYRGGAAANVGNVLARQFHASGPNQKWVTDVTEFKVGQEKLYLSPVLDLYNGEIIAYQMDRRPQFHLVKTMINTAIERLAGEKPLIHSDQGWQYQMRQYHKILVEHGLTQSMSRKGNCLDNAAMESFFATLKSEFFYLNKFENLEQLKAGLKAYIHYYNHDRIRSKLKGLSPVEYRTQPLLA